MSMLQKYVVNKLLFDNNPELIKNQCMNSRQSKKKCTVCQEICPAGALNGEALDASLCVGCNTCVAACPCQCLRPSKKFMSRIMDIFEQDKEHWLISCENQDYPADLKLPCLRSLPWEVMAILSLKCDLSFISKDCAQCSQQHLLKVWKQSLAKLQAFMGSDLFARKIHVCTDEVSSPQQTYSRREAFSFIFSKLKNTTLNTLALDDKSLDPDGSIYRQLLVYRLLQLPKELSSSDARVPPEISGLDSPQVFSWQYPDFTDQCTACNICVKICTGKALHRVEAKEQQPNKRTWYMAVIPWRCTNCGLCLMVCPRKGIDNLSYKTVQDPTKPQVVAITAPVCHRCGEPMPGESGDTCSFCRAEAGAKIAWSFN